MLVKFAALSLVGLAALAPFVARRRLFVAAALCWAAYGLWELRGTLWRWLTPASRVALAILVGLALTSFPPWIDAPIVTVTVLGTAAINRARERRAERLAQLEGEDGYLAAAEDRARNRLSMLRYHGD
jgi:hypothetical protein